MKRMYKTIKDHNNKSGNNARKWEYFDVTSLNFLYNLHDFITNKNLDC